MPQNGHGTPVTVRSGHGGPSVDGSQGRTAATASIPAPATRSGFRSIPSEDVLSGGAGASAIAGVAGVGTVAVLTTGERSSRGLLSYPRADLAATTASRKLSGCHPSGAPRPPGDRRAEIGRAHVRT